MQNPKIAFTRGVHSFEQRMQLCKQETIILYTFLSQNGRIIFKTMQMFEQQYKYAKGKNVGNEQHCNGCKETNQ